MFRFYDLMSEEIIEMLPCEIETIEHTEECIVITNMDGIIFNTKKIDYRE